MLGFGKPKRRAIAEWGESMSCPSCDWEKAYKTDQAPELARPITCPKCKFTASYARFSGQVLDIDAATTQLWLINQEIRKSKEAVGNGGILLLLFGVLLFTFGFAGGAAVGAMGFIMAVVGICLISIGSTY